MNCVGRVLIISNGPRNRLWQSLEDRNGGDAEDQRFRKRTGENMWLDEAECSGSAVILKSLETDI